MTADTPGGDDDALASLTHVQHWFPTSAELDDVELALAVRGTSPDLEQVSVVLPVPASGDGADTPTASAPGELLLTDAEGTPLAHFTVAETELLEPEPLHAREVIGAGLGSRQPARWRLTGAVAPVRPAEHGPFRAMRRTAEQVRTAAPAPFVVLADRPLQHGHVAAIRSAAGWRSIVVLALIGSGSPLLVPAAGLVRASEAATVDLRSAVTVPVPFRRDPDAATDAVRRRALAFAYGARGDDDWLDVATVKALPPDEIERRLDAGESLDASHAAVVAHVVTTAHRSRDQRGLTILFSGLSGSGKSTIARAFAERIEDEGRRTLTLLDGDVVRRLLSSGLTFSRADRETNIRRIGWVAAEINRHGGLAVCCPIAPYASTRADVRSMVTAAGGTFVLVHVATPLSECERRDRKGFYAKARAGLMPEFTGITDPYEVPDDADLRIDTTDVTVATAVQQVIEHLESRGLLRPLGTD